MPQKDYNPGQEFFSGRRSFAKSLQQQPNYTGACAAKVKDGNRRLFRAIALIASRKVESLLRLHAGTLKIGCWRKARKKNSAYFRDLLQNLSLSLSQLETFPAFTHWLTAKKGRSSLSLTVS